MKPTKCARCLGNELYERYHDEERWVPVYDDTILFEFLILEWAQAGLSRITILKRREWYRQAFAHRNIAHVAAFDENKIIELLQNPGIIKNKLKVRSAIKNAQIFMSIQQEFGSFSTYLRSRVDNKQIINHRASLEDCPTTTPLSDTISKDLKKRWMSFVGSTIIYAYLQAVGVINDHITTCWKHPSR